MRRNERKAVMLLLGLLWIVAITWLAFSMGASAATGPGPRLERDRAAVAQAKRAGLTTTAQTEQAPDDAPPGDDPAEAERIEAALEEQGYFRADIPLDYDTQDLLHTAAEEFGVPYELALAVVAVESGYQNIVGDDGQSVGYMQVQARWHRARMEALGVTDLTDPYSNFRVGCNFLAELLDRLPTEDALTWYNAGRTGPSGYAADVITKMEELRTWS